jgi:hypothetical protein
MNRNKNELPPTTCMRYGFQNCFNFINRKATAHTQTVGSNNFRDRLEIEKRIPTYYRTDNWDNYYLFTF